MQKKIIIIDDEKDFVDVIKQTLFDEGYSVLTAYDGEEGLDKIRTKAPDLVILDINMPKMDGYAVCREIRQDPLYRNLPIIFLTVRNEKESKIKGMNLGSDEYIIKPFRPKELLLRIKKIFEIISRN